MLPLRRNQSCPCRSGRKYKHCCLQSKGFGTPTPPVLSLTEEIRRLQQAASQKKKEVYELGVFVCLSMENGDAWVLESTEKDAIQVAAAGQALSPVITEDQERIEVDWTHTFALRQRKLFFTAYGSAQEVEVPLAPTMQIQAAIRRIMKYTPAHLLQQIHLKVEGA